MSAKPSLAAGQFQMVDKILNTKRVSSRSYITFVWAVFFLFLTGMIYLELTYRAVDWSVFETYPVTWYLANVLMGVLGIYGGLLLLTYLVSHFKISTVEITPQQQKLFGVSDSDPRFRIVPPTSAAETVPAALVPQYSPSSYTSRPLYSFRSSPVKRDMAMSSPSSLPRKTFDDSSFGLNSQEIIASHWSPLLLDRGASRSVLSGGSESFLGQQGSTGYMSSLLNSSSYQADGNINISPVNSPWARASNMSPFGRGGSPTSPSTVSSASYAAQQDLMNGSFGLRSRLSKRNSSPKKSSPLRMDDFISSPEDLDNYLQDFNATKDMNVQSGIPDVRSSPASGFSFWSFNRTMMDYIPMIHRYQYQLAPPSLPQSTTSVDNPQHDFSVCPVFDDAWSKLDVDSSKVDQWLENLRKWICRTILNRLIGEISEVNKTLINIGSEEIQIGEVSLSTLKQFSTAKGQLVPKLLTLIPFLDLSPNQEYLVQRIRELGSGGCMSAFKWNGGGDFKGMAWEENLPTDSAIVVHMLCCYMDLRLPSHPKYPDGKTFTSQHFLRAPDKPNLKDRKDHLLIYETRLHPPQYSVVIEDTIWNVKPGRNNLFHAILLFLYHVKTKEHGMLRRVSLGLSGINILWVFDS